jgi:hypothetical protein
VTEEPMYNRRRSAEIAQRVQERRDREDSARRLADEFPALEALSLQIKQFRPEGGAADSDHIRRVVVENAPALFHLPCSERTCQDGGYEITPDVMRALRAGQSRFEGESVCNGRVGNNPCNRRLRYVGTAVFSASGARASDPAAR